MGSGAIIFRGIILAIVKNHCKAIKNANWERGRGRRANERWAAQPPSQREPGAAGAWSMSNLSGDAALRPEWLKRYNIGEVF